MSTKNVILKNDSLSLLLLAAQNIIEIRFLLMAEQQNLTAVITHEETKWSASIKASRAYRRSVRKARLELVQRCCSCAFSRSRRAIHFLTALFQSSSSNRNPFEKEKHMIGGIFGNASAWSLCFFISFFKVVFFNIPSKKRCIQASSSCVSPLISATAANNWQ